MSYDISFRVKVEGVDKWIPVGHCNANTTWNVREMITTSTGLEWKNEQDNELVNDVIPAIYKGLYELTNFPEKYKKYESDKGWGTIRGTITFFQTIIDDWEQFKTEYETADFADVTHFWIV